MQGEALKFFNDFLKYANMKPEKMASVMNYELDGFKKRVKLIERAHEKAEKIEDDDIDYSVYNPDDKYY